MKTKFQTVCNIVFLFLLLISCTTKDTNKKVSDTSSVLQEMVSDQIAVNYSKDTLTINVDSLHLENNDEYLIFLLNTDCSFCIGQFLNFIAYYNKKDVHMPLIAIIEEGSTEIAMLQSTSCHGDVDLQSPVMPNRIFQINQKISEENR